VECGDVTPFLLWEIPASSVAAWTAIKLIQIKPDTLKVPNPTRVVSRVMANIEAVSVQVKWS
jgi:hypothetical protein